MVKAYLVLRGGSSDFTSPYATTSALALHRVNHLSPQRPQASPWMGEPQTRADRMPSGYQKAFHRDLPPGEHLADNSHSRDVFGRPKTVSVDEMQPWTGEKDAAPLKSCVHRGQIKEPRFYPFKMGSAHGADVLVSPPEADSSARFAPAPQSTEHKHGLGQMGPIVQHRGKPLKPPTGYATGNDMPKVKALITAPQGQAEFHVPPLTMRQAESVASDSSTRYFHARDYYENPYLTSSQYYQTDALAQHAEMKRNKESLTAVPSTRPLTQYALVHNDAPYAPDVGEGVGLPIPKVGEGVYDAVASWGRLPPESERKGLMPTGFSRGGHGLTPTAAKDELPPAPPLPDRFARLRARHDYLRWGTPSGDNPYRSTSRVELCRPSVQEPLGGPRKMPPGGAKTMPSDMSGYHMQITPNPIQPDFFD